MSTLRVNTLQNAAGTGQPAMSGAAKAWVNFNGTGTVAIRASFNVTSITDGGVGIYTVNFTNTLDDANYAVTLGVIPDSLFVGTAAARLAFISSQVAANVVIHTGYQANGSTAGTGYLDFPEVNVAVFR